MLHKKIHGRFDWNVSVTNNLWATILCNLGSIFMSVLPDFLNLSYGLRSSIVLVHKGFSFSNHYTLFSELSLV